jgi:hypothetical protein
MMSSPKKSDLPQTLEELAAKEHADFEDVQHNLGDLAEGVELLRGDLTKALKDVTDALASLKADFNDLSQQKRAQHIAITRLEPVPAEACAPSLVNNALPYTLPRTAVHASCRRHWALPMSVLLASTCSIFRPTTAKVPRARG